MLAQFAAAGLDTSRVDLLPLAAANSDHLGTYAHMDISLDPFPYAGTTTTCESLYMGVPVVTLQGGWPPGGWPPCLCRHSWTLAKLIACINLSRQHTSAAFWRSLRSHVVINAAWYLILCIKYRRAVPCAQRGRVVADRVGHARGVGGRQ